MLKKFGKYLLRKITNSTLGNFIKWSLWGLLCFYGPGLIPIIGFEGLALTSVVVYSGIIENSVANTVTKNIIQE